MRAGTGVERGESNARAHAAPESVRNLAIDRFRGVLVILMVGGDYLSGVRVVPALLKHAPDIGFTVADTVASAFVFVIGLNYGTSFARRARSGTAAAYRHFVVRYLALIGLGALVAGGAVVSGVPTDWGVLQALGVAGLICLAVIRLPTWARFAMGALMLIGYQYVLGLSMLSTVLHTVHGGLFGALSWAALLVLSTAVADVWRSGRAPYAICCAALAVAAALSAVVVPVSKNRVSLSFVLITLAISALVFLAFEYGARFAPQGAGFFCWWGENALALYFLHLVILSLVVVPPAAWWYAEAPGWLAALQLIVILTVLSAVAWWMHRRGLRLGL
ncbi:heparan-alpha-glucosaminide N-acetyltransferase domain-containing protein [Lacisediminihabitans sp.]|uniref:heparan-alpha-glucosaminide N-acetyltransferase domain-containing protein n=1 Tax=Lacisediminihabitans sp. TaxID=2787631 RepID=UPI00374D2FB6